jgi:hypothetical protein
LRSVIIGVRHDDSGNRGSALLVRTPMRADQGAE